MVPSLTAHPLLAPHVVPSLTAHPLLAPHVVPSLTAHPLLALHVVPSLTAHPLLALHEAGVLVTVNSDDPPHFGGYANDNYVGIADALGLTRCR